MHFLASKPTVHKKACLRLQACFRERVKVCRRLAGKLFSLKCLFDVEERGGDNVW